MSKPSDGLEPSTPSLPTHTPRANLVRRRLDFVARPLVPAIRRPDRCVREDDPLVGHRGPYALRRALHGARPPGFVLVREPDELGLERAHPQPALGARLVELAEANGHVAADDDRTTTTTCMPRVWPGAGTRRSPGSSSSSPSTGS
jgi:hypothetical protein